MDTDEAESTKSTDPAEPALHTTRALCVYEFPTIFGLAEFPLEFRLVCGAWRDLFDDFAPRNLYYDKTIRIRGEGQLLVRIPEIDRIKRWFGLHVVSFIPESRFLGSIHTLSLGGCQEITDVSALGRVYDLSLS